MVKFPHSRAPHLRAPIAEHFCTCLQRERRAKCDCRHACRLPPTIAGERERQHHITLAQNTRDKGKAGRAGSMCSERAFFRQHLCWKREKRKERRCRRSTGSLLPPSRNLPTAVTRVITDCRCNLVPAVTENPVETIIRSVSYVKFRAPWDWDTP